MSNNTGTLSPPNLATNTASRIMAVDILRGIIMVIMALDHTRDYFSNFKGDPLDFESVGVLMFFTRWITHFCAPVFVFLSGTSAFLSMSRGKSVKQQSLLLLTRGCWLIILELTIVRFGWMFNIDYHIVVAQVIWAIGWSMIVLSALVFLRVRYIAIIGAIIVIGHNWLDKYKSTEFEFPGLWKIFHQSGAINYGDHYTFFVIYPLIPWIGVMALGYCFGSILIKPVGERNKWLLGIGASVIIAFIAIRASNIYGDRRPWHHDGTALKTILDFIKVEKYPPSLLYLLMTIGPAIILMPLIERMKNPVGRFFTVYGRVPMFYYILHIYLIHFMAMATGVIMGFHASEFSGSILEGIKNWGFPLHWVYLFWLAAVLILYLPCLWYMRMKMKHKKWWMRYL